MDLKELGEFGLIDLIKQDAIVNPDGVVAGIGDDAAVVAPPPGYLQLLTADMLVETIHFDLAAITPWQLGYKAMAVNFSDIAAMGGVPRQALVSLAMPRRMEVAFVKELYDGMKAICRQFGVNIIGGDTVSSPAHLVINVTVAGQAVQPELQLRSGAKPGQLVAVTGRLGNSSAGLALLMQGGWQTLPFAQALIDSHVMPTPQVVAARLIAPYSSSMNDISDGLASEANEIAAASGVGMQLCEKDLPLSDELQAASRYLGTAARDYALYGGEDYQLLFTIERAQWPQLVAADCLVPLTVIGQVTDQPGEVQLVGCDGRIQTLTAGGYNHFA